MLTGVVPDSLRPRNFVRVDLAPGERLALGRHAPPAFAPGTAFRYVDYNYIVLAAVVERVTGRRLDDLILQLHFWFSQAASVMSRLRAYLVATTPVRPAEHVRRVRPSGQGEPHEQMPNFRDGQREERGGVDRAGRAARLPLFRGAALARTAARKAWAKSASVM